MGEENDPEKINFVSLLIWGILHCQDRQNCKMKATALYSCLQDGGEERHAQIAASDKDWKPVSQKLFAFASIDVAKASGNDNLYSEKEKSLIEGTFDQLLNGQVDEDGNG